ncbi:MAG: DUF2075 domain-containing protein [Ignavibacteria bacterium]|nr:DUF2075 domain-containing protein [Ignavibacteria bacterium]
MNEIKEITEEILKFRNERDWKQFHNAKDLALAISIEAGELLELFLWKKADEADEEKVKEEIADIMIYALLISEKYGFDVREIVLEKIESNKEKYPVEKVKGSVKNIMKILMIVYKNSSKGFINDVDKNIISDKIKNSVLENFLWEKVNKKEEMSWINSMQFIGKVIKNAQIADDCGILIEYNLPSTSKRVDFIITGKDESDRSGFIIIELKQWLEAKSTKKDGLVYTDYFGNTLHPSYQAYSYKLYLKDYNENVYNNSLQIKSCAYLHNYTERNPEPLRDEIYSDIVSDSPIYFKDDQTQLEEFIRIFVGKGKGEEIVYQIENGNIKPSKKLIDHVCGLFKGNSEFVLLDEQKIAFETAKEIALTATKKTVVIINGGPGTGKSVVSMNLLGLLKDNQNVVFVAPNSSFREVMLAKLVGTFDSNRVRHLLKGSSSFYNVPENTFDVLIVDEAHRLKNGNAFMYKGKNQVEDIIKAAKVSIFFIDEKQMIRPDDIGTLEEIKRVTELHKAEIQSIDLKAQFRCSGAEGFINWVEDVLQLEATGNFDGWDTNDFMFKICDSPNELRYLIGQEIDKGSKARILAGYAWPWTPAKNGNANGQIEDVNIPEFDFSMPWNSRQIGTKFAIDDDGINQIGCVHTSQGLEFDYVGIIVGKIFSSILRQILFLQTGMIIMILKESRD